MAQQHHESDIDHEDDGDDQEKAEDNDNSVHLFEEEEQDFLIVPVTPDVSLRVRQYNSHHDNWGIYSTVWEGGYALIDYMRDCLAPHSDRHPTVVFDVGSGTGIVGLAAAVLFPHSCRRIYLTDLPEALSLIRENMQLMQDMAIPTQSTVHCQPLVWGATCLENWQSNDLLPHVTSHDRILIMGAEIVYRPSLFEPLLRTLQHLRLALATSECTYIQILLSCNSCRSHLIDFWHACDAHHFQVRPVAVVERSHSSSIVSRLEGDWKTAFPPPHNGRVYIVQLEGMSTSM
jgi:hypothetical protein